MEKVVVIGGGTGTYTALSGLVKHSGLKLAAIISMADSGGSNRVIRDEFGLLPTSDIRQVMVALTPVSTSEVLRKLFTYRFTQGTGISGMTFGNLFMAALADIMGSQKLAIDETCKLLGIRHQILPVTYDQTNLVARYTDGGEVLGEHYVDEMKENRQIESVYLLPKAQINPQARKALLEADKIMLGPGDLYTSVVSNLLVDGMQQTLQSSKAKLIYAVNLMTRFGQTLGYTAGDHVREIEKYAGRRMDVVIVNSPNKYPREALDWYAKASTEPVKDDLGGGDGRKVVRAQLAGENFFTKSPGDQLTRSLIRHDSHKLAEAILKS